MLRAVDLALIYLQQGRTAELRQLAEEMHTLFEAEDVYREAGRAPALPGGRPARGGYEGVGAGIWPRTSSGRG